MTKFRVIALDAAGAVSVLRQYDSSAKALRLFNLACVAGCYVRVQVQTYAEAEGWQLTAPAVEWSKPAKGTPARGDVGPQLCLNVGV